MELLTFILLMTILVIVLVVLIWGGTTNWKFIDSLYSCVKSSTTAKCMENSGGTMSLDKCKSTCTSPSKITPPPIPKPPPPPPPPSSPPSSPKPQKHCWVYNKKFDKCIKYYGKEAGDTIHFKKKRVDGKKIRDYDEKCYKSKDHCWKHHDKQLPQKCCAVVDSYNNVVSRKCTSGPDGSNNPGIESCTSNSDCKTTYNVRRGEKSLCCDLHTLKKDHTCKSSPTPPPGPGPTPPPGPSPTPSPPPTPPPGPGPTPTPVSGSPRPMDYYNKRESASCPPGCAPSPSRRPRAGAGARPTPPPGKLPNNTRCNHHEECLSNICNKDGFCGISPGDTCSPIPKGAVYINPDDNCQYQKNILDSPSCAVWGLPRWTKRDAAGSSPSAPYKCCGKRGATAFTYPSGQRTTSLYFCVGLSPGASCEADAQCTSARCHGTGPVTPNGTHGAPFKCK